MTELKSEIKDGECVHGDNLARCPICSPEQYTPSKSEKRGETQKTRAQNVMPSKDAMEKAQELIERNDKFILEHELELHPPSSTQYLVELIAQALDARDVPSVDDFKAPRPPEQEEYNWGFYEGVRACIERMNGGAR